MAKVLGIHEVELKPGVKAEDFEAFVEKEIYPAWHERVPGLEIHILRGDRGGRDGKYVRIFEFDSVETRNRYFPSPGVVSEELKMLLKPIEAVIEKGRSFTSYPIYTDYVMVGK